MLYHRTLLAFFPRLYQEEGKGIFTTRMNILGHMQQGGRPTPFDRNMGTKMAAKSFNWLVQQLNVDGVYDKDKETAFTKEKTSCCLLGLRARAYQYQPIANLKAETDFQVLIAIFVGQTSSVHYTQFGL